MHGYQLRDYADADFSVAMTADLDRLLARHLNKGPLQEDLTFAYWKPSRGKRRYTAILQQANLPQNGERLLSGNVAFTSEYLGRVLEERPLDCGVALLHSHLGPGWQDMSEDDVVAERDRLGGLVASITQLPVLGLTWGTDGTWSARFWLRSGRHRYERKWASTVRSVGRDLRVSFHPRLRSPPRPAASQVATVSVWGQRAQQDLARARVGIVGLGSVGSIACEILSRTGVQVVTLIDHDHIEERNLDRTIGAYANDVSRKAAKVEIARRQAELSHTAEGFSAVIIEDRIESPAGMAAVLDCDVLLCCVDRPWPRHILNVISYSHLIPVIDGGILARVREDGHLLHVDWRIHAVGPERACLYCLGALLRSDVALDREGLLDDPDYLKGLSQSERERYGRRNVVAFSASVAAHQVLQLIGIISSNARVGGQSPQAYHAYPGVMEVLDTIACCADCDVAAVTTLAHANILG